MKLPAAFLDKMKTLLGEMEFQEFLASYHQPRHYGLRVNTLKISVEEFLKISPFTLEPIPWTKDGFYYKEGEMPGRHPYYHAGLYYIQEPSAMLPGVVLNAQPGDLVLDLCAAPGGKTVQLGAAMKGKGLLVANDISSDRVKALVKNIELCGIRNAIVTNEDPAKLAAKFPEFFDRILVDAPCSGEGMFRKDEDAARSWENFKCDRCAGMQREILQEADKMLKPGGFMVYSTCTFAPEEDERMIAEFLSKHPEYKIGKILDDQMVMEGQNSEREAMIGRNRGAGIAPGRPEWADGNGELAGTVRLWPHRIKGEGHFVALLRKGCKKDAIAAASDESMESASKRILLSLKGLSPNELAGFTSFLLEQLGIDILKDVRFGDEIEMLNINRTVGNFETLRDTFIKGYFHLKGKNLYHLPVSMPDLSGIRIAKFGWYLGEFEKERFEPSHSLILSLKKPDLKKCVDLSAQSREMSGYLKGETLMLDCEKGFVGIFVDGYSIGWAKSTGDILKNLYPRGWRRMN